MTLSVSLGREWAQPLLRWLALAAFALLIFLPGFATLPVIDRDEARFVQASRQMVQSGDYIDIRFQDEARHKKPVGIYWLQTLSVAASGQGEAAPLWVYRLPSLAGAVLAVVLVAVIGIPMFGTGPAFLAAAVFAAGFVIGGEARIPKTDAALLATILIAQAALARFWLQKDVRQAWTYAFWLAIAASVLIKGPIGPMVSGLTVAALVLWDRRAGWLRPLAAPIPILLALAIALPWFVAITLRSDGGFWQASVGADLLAKVASGQEGKGAPPGTYLLLMVFTFWPATALLLLSAPQIWAARRDRATGFLIAWVVPVWIVHEAIPTKLLHYTLPVFPALALLAVGHLPKALQSAPRWLRVFSGLAMLPGIALGAGVVYGATVTDAPKALWLAAAGVAAAILAMTLAWRALAQGAAVPLVLACAAMGALLHAALFPAVARMPALWPTDQAMAIADEIAASQNCAAPILTSWGYSEPSVVWRGGVETRLLAASTPLDQVMRPGPCKVLLRNSASDTAETPIPGCRPAGSVEGLAIGAGDWVTLQVLDCRGAP
jgi:4-amino-4-deoxy-L-arabinose transferase-like glycosyltransferase